MAWFRDGELLGPRRYAVGRSRERPESGGGPRAGRTRGGRVCIKPSEQHRPVAERWGGRESGRRWGGGLRCQTRPKKHSVHGSQPVVAKTSEGDQNFSNATLVPGGWPGV